MHVHSEIEIPMNPKVLENKKKIKAIEQQISDSKKSKKSSPAKSNKVEIVIKSSVPEINNKITIEKNVLGNTPFKTQIETDRDTTREIERPQKPSQVNKSMAEEVQDDKIESGFKLDLNDLKVLQNSQSNQNIEATKNINVPRVMSKKGSRSAIN